MHTVLPGRIVGLLGGAILAACWAVPLRASTADALLADLAGQDETARALARQLLVREDPVEIAPRLARMLEDEKLPVRSAAFMTLADIANELAVPGRQRERAEVAGILAARLTPEASADLKQRVLRLLVVAVPAGFDVAPIAALLADPGLREPARACLVEMGTPEAAEALCRFLPQAEAAFQPAILHGLGQMREVRCIEPVRQLLSSENPEVRAAAALALAWTGDPWLLPEFQAVLDRADPATRRDAVDALVRLVNRIEQRGGNWETAAAGYREMLAAADPVLREAGLAGLGRIGDGSCVPAMLEAVKASDNPARLVGIAALREMRGVDVTRAIVEAYPGLKAPLQLDMLEVLAARKHPMVAGILKDAAQSQDPAMRLAGLSGLAEAGLAEGIDLLIAAARGGGEAERPVARAGLIAVAEALRAQGARGCAEAGRASLAAWEVADPADREFRRRALAGLTACPIPQAFEAVKAAAADSELSDQLPALILAVGGALTAADRKAEALELYELLRGMRPATGVMAELARAMHAAGAEVDLQGLLGTVTRWWVVGPFELGEQNAGWETACVGEPDISLVARYMSGKRRVAWTRVVTDDPGGIVDLRKTVADTDHAVAYAYTEIELPEAVDAVLLVGTDDSQKLWVNGQLVHDRFVARALTADEDRIPVKLQAGTNRILMKVWQNVMGWAFCMRIVDGNGRALAFVQKDG